MDISSLIRQIDNTSEARQLPCGTAVGDTCGGRTFSDNIAAILERRSYRGWIEFDDGEKRWTLIIVDRSY